MISEHNMQHDEYGEEFHFSDVPEFWTSLMRASIGATLVIMGAKVVPAMNSSLVRPTEPEHGLACGSEA